MSKSGTKPKVSGVSFVEEVEDAAKPTEGFFEEKKVEEPNEVVPLTSYKGELRIEVLKNYLFCGYLFLYFCRPTVIYYC